MKAYCPHCGMLIDSVERDRLILAHLAREDIPMPSDGWDMRAMPRTVDGMMRALNIPRPTLYKYVVKMLDAGLIEAGPVRLRPTYGTLGFHTYRTTDAGKEALQ